MNGFNPCPDCSANEADRDEALYQLDEARAEAQSARTITRDEFNSAVIIATNAFGAAIEHGHFRDKFEIQVRAVLDHLGFEVKSA
jgi:hypothetical protein